MNYPPDDHTPIFYFGGPEDGKRVRVALPSTVSAIQPVGNEDGCYHWNDQHKRFEWRLGYNPRGFDRALDNDPDRF